MPRPVRKPEPKNPKEQDWTCIYCEKVVEGGSIHRCNK